MATPQPPQRSAVDAVVEHLKASPKARVLLVGTQESLPKMRAELLAAAFPVLSPVVSTQFQELLFGNGSTVRYLTDREPARLRGHVATAVWLDTQVSAEAFGECERLRNRNSDSEALLFLENRPVKYSPPTELLERAALELSRATPRELATAALAYTAYNSAAGGRSAVTGAPLPTWEQNTNVLVKYSWLMAAQAVQRPVLAEVDAVAKELEDLHRDIRERVEAVLTDEHVAASFARAWLGLVHLRVDQHGGMNTTRGLLEALLGLTISIAQEVAELRLCVGATFNTMAEEGSLGSGHQKLLEAAALRMEGAGFKGSAEFLRDCAAGRAEVVLPVGFTVDPASPPQGVTAVTFDMGKPPQG